jgi:Mg2+-importing ATPase
VALVVRTRRPFFRSRPGTWLLISTLAVGAVTLVIPYLPFAGVLGFVPLPIPVTLALVGITGLYVLTAEVTKKLFYARRQV